MKPNEILYGKDPGTFFADKNHLNQLSEEELYIYIEQFEFALHQMSSILTAEEFLSYELALEYCMMQTRKFGVTIYEPKPGEHVEKTNSFLAWFEWWDSYYSNLSPEEKKNSLKKRPNGHWRDLLPENNIIQLQPGSVLNIHPRDVKKNSGQIIKFPTRR